MKETSSKPARHSAQRLNYYAPWKYIVLIIGIILLGLSALPTWYGDAPSIQIAQAKETKKVLSVTDVRDVLAKANVPVRSIEQANNKFTLIFNDETEQSNARKALDSVLNKEDTITFSYVSVAPAWLTDLGLNPIKLGLDLRGGVQFLLNVDVDKAFDEQRNTMIDELRDYFRQQRIRGVQLSQVANNGIHITASTSESLSQVDAYLKKNYAGWQIRRSSDALTVQPTEQNRLEFQTTTVQQNLKIMRDRIEELGITEALVQRQGENAIRIELPGVQDPTQAKKVIGATATLAFHEALSPSEPVTYSSMVLPDNNGRSVAVAKRPVLAGEHIINARAGLDNMGMAEVNISLDHAGGKMMSDFSGKHVGKPMATVYKEYTTNAKGDTELKERVISVATIQTQLGSQFRITGAGSLEDAQQLALLLRAGSLTAPVTIVEERTIGASLGAENIKNGFAALALGMLMTLVFMAIWYRRLGWVANLALLVNMVCLLGLISLLPGAVLTLPGIAGLVLTVGMAVDTNVLIFERIRDKMAEGRTFSQSIDQGFRSAFNTILDANITTLITAVILYAIGNGPIQGFALTLGLGILTSMFTGVFTSRAIINLVWGRDGRRDVRI